MSATTGRLRQRNRKPTQSAAPPSAPSDPLGQHQSPRRAGGRSPRPRPDPAVAAARDRPRRPVVDRGSGGAAAVAGSSHPCAGRARRTRRAPVEVLAGLGADRPVSTGGVGVVRSSTPDRPVVRPVILRSSWPSSSSVERGRTACVGGPPSSAPGRPATGPGASRLLALGALHDVQGVPPHGRRPSQPLHRAGVADLAARGLAADQRDLLGRRVHPGRSGRRGRRRALGTRDPGRGRPRSQRRRRELGSGPAGACGS